MTISPPDSRSHWISPKELYHWLKSPYQADLELVFPHPLAKIISRYADYNLGKNSKNWYIALIKLGVLPDKIPPLPLNIHNILDLNCPMHLDQPNLDGTYKKINDTHFLCLIPAGRIDTLAERKFGAEHAHPYLSAFHYGPALHNPDITSFNEPEWVLIANVLLPGSENMDYAEQIRICDRFIETTDIESLSPGKERDSSTANVRQVPCRNLIDSSANSALKGRDCSRAAVHYEIPSFKHALAANLLYAAAEKKGLWGDSLSTRVKETFYWKSKTLRGWWPSSPCTKRTLIVVDPYSMNSAEIGVDQVVSTSRSHQLGITLLWNITNQTPKPPPACPVS